MPIVPIHSKLRQSTESDANPCESIQGVPIHSNRCQSMPIHPKLRKSIQSDANPCKLIPTHANQANSFQSIPNNRWPIRSNRSKIQASPFKSMPINSNSCHPCHPTQTQANPCQYIQIHTNPMCVLQSMPNHAAPFKPMPSYPHTSIGANPHQAIKVHAYQYQPIKSLPIHANLLRSMSTNPHETNLSVATMDWNADPRVAAFAVFTVFKRRPRWIAAEWHPTKYQNTSETYQI